MSRGSLNLGRERLRRSAALNIGEISDESDSSDDRIRTGTLAPSLHRPIPYNQEEIPEYSEREPSGSRRGAQARTGGMQRERRPTDTEQQTTYNEPVRGSVSTSEPGNQVAQGVQISRELRAFLEIKRGNYRSCAAFIERHPTILSEDLSPLQQAAGRAMFRGQEEMARTIVERMFLLRGQMADEKGAFVQRLTRHRRAVVEFEQALESYYKKLVAWAQAQQQMRPGIPGLLDDLNLDSPVDENASSAAPSSKREGRPSRRDSVNTHQSSRISDVHETKSVITTPLDAPRPFGTRSSERDLDNSPSRSISSRPGSTMDSSFRVRVPPRAFFTVGRVFKVVWHQPAGSDIYGRVADHSTSGPYGQPIYSQLRWMLVIKPRDGYCICCPISTYSGRGLSSKNLPEREIQAHSILYSYGSSPVMVNGEPRLRKSPVPIVSDLDFSDVSPTSRINFRKHHTIEYNVKVADIGHVPEDFLSVISRYYMEEIS